MNQGRYQNIEDFSTRWAANYQVGYNKYYFLDGSSADATVPEAWQFCRAIRCEQSGLVRIQYQDEHGVNYTDIIYLIAGDRHPVRNVRRMYQYLSGTTAGTAASYNEVGTLVTNAIKLLK